MREYTKTWTNCIWQRKNPSKQKLKTNRVLGYSVNNGGSFSIWSCKIIDNDIKTKQTNVFIHIQKWLTIFLNCSIDHVIWKSHVNKRSKHVVWRSDYRRWWLWRRLKVINLKIQIVICIPLSRVVVLNLDKNENPPKLQQ